MAAPAEALAAGRGHKAEIELQSFSWVQALPQRVGESVFAARFLVGSDGRGSGMLRLRSDRHRLFRVQNGDVLCEGGRPVGVEIRGAALETGAGARPVRGQFSAVVRPSAEIEECLIFDLTGSGVRTRVEAEGRLRFGDGVCGPRLPAR